MPKYLKEVTIGIGQGSSALDSGTSSKKRVHIVGLEHYFLMQVTIVKSPDLWTIPHLGSENLNGQCKEQGRQAAALPSSPAQCKDRRHPV